MAYCKDCFYCFSSDGYDFCGALPVMEEIYVCRKKPCIYFKKKEKIIPKDTRCYGCIKTKTCAWFNEHGPTTECAARKGE